MTKTFDVTIVGAGIVGVAAGYYLTRAGLKVALVDRLQPMSFTSAQSGENYRNWWPHPTMTAFTNRSITLMEDLSTASDNCLLMTRRGYLLASRDDSNAPQIDQLRAGYGARDGDVIRVHEKGSSSYVPAASGKWQDACDGVDVLRSPALIKQHYPYLDPSVSQLVHIRRGGEISSYSMGQYMLSVIRAGGGVVYQGDVEVISQGSNFEVSLKDQDEPIMARHLVNAAGPFAADIAAMLGVALPIENILQQKIAFEDKRSAIPRDMPFVVDLDPCSLNWTAEDREILAEDDETKWLTDPIEGVIHCRPDGGENGRWIKLGWAFNKQATTPCWEPDFDPIFPDIVLRGASRLNPALTPYIGCLPRNAVHYGGYYSMTRENWPLIGPMGPANAFVVGAMSGFGTMAACGAGELIAAWITGDDLPSYAKELSMARYENPALMENLYQLATGVI